MLLKSCFIECERNGMKGLTWKACDTNKAERVKSLTHVVNVLILTLFLLYKKAVTWQLIQKSDSVEVKPLCVICNPLRISCVHIACLQLARHSAACHSSNTPTLPTPAAAASKRWKRWKGVAGGWGWGVTHWTPSFNECVAPWSVSRDTEVKCSVWGVKLLYRKKSFFIELQSLRAMFFRYYQTE